MDEQFKQECAALLELAQEIAIKYLQEGEHMCLSIFQKGTGWISTSNGRLQDVTIGYQEPKNKAITEQKESD